MQHVGFRGGACGQTVHGGGRGRFRAWFVGRFRHYVGKNNAKTLIHD